MTEEEDRAREQAADEAEYRAKFEAKYLHVEAAIIVAETTPPGSTIHPKVDPDGASREDAYRNGWKDAVREVLRRLEAQQPQDAA